MNGAKPRATLVKVPVSDPERAVTHCPDVLGFAGQFTVPEYGWSSLAAGDVALGLYVPGLGGGSATPGGSAGFQIRVADLRALHAPLAGRGALLDGGLYTSADGMQCVEITEPDGNVLRVSRAAPEGGA